MKFKRMILCMILILFSKVYSQNLPSEYWKLPTEKLSTYSETDAQVELAHRYLFGSNGEKIDFEKAYEILKKAEQNLIRLKNGNSNHKINDPN